MLDLTEIPKLDLASSNEISTQKISVSDHIGGFQYTVDKHDSFVIDMDSFSYGGLNKGINQNPRITVPIQVNKYLAYSDGMRVIESGKLPSGQPCLDSEEFKIVSDLNEAISQERYKDAADLRDKLDKFWAARNLRKFTTKHCKNRIPKTRKIDIKLYHSYQSLTNSLITMFAKDQKCDEDDYILTYQDKEGEWLIAGDIPWENFVRSVQRREIVKKRMKKPIYVYYQLDNFYQNHQRCGRGFNLFKLEKLRLSTSSSGMLFNVAFHDHSS
ncbi:hypothetical protein PVK06_048449 [Gossypium arboreum]|uniref:Auxin-responsive protein n=1 Tax=Gossypium arboreum TaxID=29729 RepID=A0ABR0MGG5_GOSAR|nr:hypothetical protein PVK06_048449 [Gossypium arboreum]